jgi:hypothetical protein
MVEYVGKASKAVPGSTSSSTAVEVSLPPTHIQIFRDHLSRHAQDAAHLVESKNMDGELP